MSFSISAGNINESHTVTINGVDVPLSDPENPNSLTVLNINAGDTVTIAITYPSADFTFYMIGGLDGFSGYVPGGGLDPVPVYDINGNVFNSMANSLVNVAGSETQVVNSFVMPQYNLNILPILYASGAVGVSPETRVDLSSITEVEFNGQPIAKLFIDGTLQWDSSLPDGSKFIDATQGITFLQV